MRRICAAISAAIILAAIALNASPAAAWVEMGCQFPTASLKWKDATTRVGYSDPAVASAGAWTSTPTPVYFTLVTSGANIQVNDGNFGESVDFDGVTYYQCNTSGYFAATVQVWWNRYLTDSYSAAKRQSVMVHELGHALGLDDTTASSCPNVEIMHGYTNTRYDICRHTTPQAGDIEGVNHLY